MPWFDVWADGAGNAIELFYVPNGQTYSVTNARALNGLPIPLRLRVVTQNPDGSLGADKLLLTFPSGARRNDTQAIAANTFVITPQGNPGSGSFTWDDYVEAGPANAASAPSAGPGPTHGQGQANP